MKCEVRVVFFLIIFAFFNIVKFMIPNIGVYQTSSVNRYENNKIGYFWKRNKKCTNFTAWKAD